MGLYKSMVIFLVVYSLLFVCIEVDGAAWNLTAEDHLELDMQLKVLNKPAIKTFRTNYGEIYDCVDFYKQPAFDHPLLKNHKIEHQRKPPSPHNDSRDHSDAILRRKICPLGTVPLKRISKEDLIRERLAAEVRPFADPSPPGTHFAGQHMDLGEVYYGAGVDGIVVYSPQCSGQQYSSGRMKISNGPDSLQIGWRVDPTLYGDSLPHFYIRIDAGETHCFNTRCPGFILIDQNIALDAALGSSRRGGPTVELREVYLIRDDKGNWHVEIGENHIQLGYYPANLFTNLQNGAAILEWGGEVFSPPGTPTPPMGAGYIPDGTSFEWDAYFRIPRRVKTWDYHRYLTDMGVMVSDNNDFKSFYRDLLSDKYFNFCAFYGGPGGSLA